MNKDLIQREKENIRQIQRITLIGMIVNILLSVIKFILGILGRSQAVIADAVHSLSDLTTDLAVLFGVQIWSKPADEDHPYGHRRIETIVTVGIGSALLVVSIGIAYNALHSMRRGQIVQPSWIALWGALISIVLKEVLYRWTLSVGKRVKSSAVVANAWHHRTDVLSSIPVAIAVAVAALSSAWSFLDHIGAFVVSLFILRVAWRILRKSFSEIIETGASKKYIEAIESIVLTTQGVKSCHALRSRQVGSGWCIDLHIQVDPHLTVHKGHEISEIVKTELLKEGSDVMDVLVHLEPFEEKQDEK